MTKLITATVVPITVDLPVTTVTADVTSNTGYDVSLIGFGGVYSAVGGFKYTEDSSTAVDALVIDFQSALSIDQASTLDVLNSSVGLVLSDSAVGSDTILTSAILGASISDDYLTSNPTATDVFTANVSTVSTEAVTGTDTVTLVVDYSYTANDSVTAIDALTASRSADPFLYEAGLVGDVLDISISTALSDIVTCTELVSVSSDIMLSESSVSSEVVTAMLQDYVSSDFFESDYTGVLYTI